MNSSIALLLLCAVFAFTAAQGQISIELASGANQWWFAVAVRNANSDIGSVQAHDSKSSSWVQLQYSNNWGFWSYSNGKTISYPVSLQITSKSGQTISVNIDPSHYSAPINTGTQFGGSGTPTTKPSGSGTTTTTKSPSGSGTTTTTKSPSGSGTTTTTKSPSSSSSSSSSSGMKLMVPLYTYPGASWTAVAQSGSKVHTVAIINPNSGPGSGPDSSYNTYMNTLKSAGVEMIGYVHTSYGARAIADVKADISKYASEFPLVNGIFIDEASDSTSQVSYYTQVHNYIMSMPGYKYNVLNPGVVPAQAYFSISTQIITYESAASQFPSSANPSYANSGNKDHFGVIAYGASASAMQTAISAAKSKGYYGWVYITDGAQGGSTYNVLTSYYAAEATYLASV